MPKSKKSESLKPGDIVTQGRRRDKLRVLQVNKGGAVLVETVKAESVDYATFYAPKEDLRVVADKADDNPPEKQLFLVTFIPAGGEEADQDSVEIETVDEDDALDEFVAMGHGDAQVLSVEPVKPV